MKVDPATLVSRDGESHARNGSLRLPASPIARLEALIAGGSHRLRSTSAPVTPGRVQTVPFSWRFATSSLSSAASSAIASARLPGATAVGGRYGRVPRRARRRAQRRTESRAVRARAGVGGGPSRRFHCDRRRRYPSGEGVVGLAHYDHRRSSRRARRAARDQRLHRTLPRPPCSDDWYQSAATSSPPSRSTRVRRRRCCRADGWRSTRRISSTTSA